MVVKRRKKQWFVVGVEPYQVDGQWHDEYGPYDTRAEADEDRRGVQRTLDRMERERERLEKRRARNSARAR